MTLDQFTHLVNPCPNPVILLEGRREIPADMAIAARKIAGLLAGRFPAMRFRSGNASGSDEAFAEGIRGHDASRLEVFVPYDGHRRAAAEGARYLSADFLKSCERSVIAEATISATPKNKGLINSTSPRLQAKAKYLLRDTLKVLGHGPAFPAPIAALFYADPKDPMAGGTGHTIRVCHEQAVPVILQDAWLLWIPELETGTQPSPTAKYPRR